MVAIMTIVGFFLRLIGSNQSFWLDEGASLEIALTPLSGFVTKMASDFHPPLFYLLLKLWLPLAGHSEWLIRLPFILIGTATIPAVYFLVKEIVDSKNHMAPRLALIFFCLSPFHIYYSQELRMYSFNALLTVLSWIYLLRAQKRSHPKYLIFFTLFNALNIYTFYGAFFNLAAQFLFIIFSRKKILPLLASLVVSFALFAPWLPTMLEQTKVGGYLKSALPGWSALSGSLDFKSLMLIPLKLLSGRISFTPKIVYYALGGLISAIYIFLAAFGAKEKRHAVLATWVIVPLIIASVVGLKTPVLGYWRFLFILPAVISLSATGLSKFSLSVGGVTFWTLVILTLIPTLITWGNPINQREDWRRLSSYINQPQSLVVVNFPAPFAPLKFYSPQADYYFTQKSLGSPRADLIETISIPASSKLRIFLLDYLSDLTDPQRTAQKALETAGFTRVGERSFKNIGVVYEYRPPAKASN